MFRRFREKEFHDHEHRERRRRFSFLRAVLMTIGLLTVLYLFVVYILMPVLATMS